MRTQYKYVDMGETFVSETDGKQYTKCNHQRGRLVGPGRDQFRNFKKNSVVEADIKESQVTAFMKVA